MQEKVQELLEFDQVIFCVLLNRSNIYYVHYFFEYKYIYFLIFNI